MADQALRLQLLNSALRMVGDAELLYLQDVGKVTRERALGGSRGGSKRSWREALLIPPTSRLTELLTRERVILQDRISLSLLPWETRITFLWEKPLVAFPH